MTPDLDQLVASASRCEVSDVVLGGASPHADPAVLALQGPAVLAQLRKLLRVRASEAYGWCMCVGDSTLRFRDGASQVLATVTLHHASSLRWDGWQGDRKLIDGRGLVEWLAAQGYGRPLQKLRADEARAAEAAAAAETWSQAAPGPARHLLPRLLATSQSGSVRPDLVDELRQALAAAWPDDRDRCRALLAWCAAGTGRYDGYPVHEGIPGILLAEIPITVLVDVLQQEPDNQGAWAGAARHLASGRARTTEELRAIPEPVRHQLLTVAKGHDATHFRRLSDSWRLPR